MAHGIQEHDKGFVFGTTWHNKPQYIQLDRFVTIAEAESVFDYPLEKVPLYRIDGEGNYVETQNFGIVRPDKDIFLTDGTSIGKRFVAESNLAMLRRIDEFILSKYPNLGIESIGTLFNGQTAFVSLKISESQVKGDKSPIETNLLYSNPIGLGSYLAYAHSTRVVCNNTLTVSRLQGLANKSLKRFSHTINAAKKIEEHLIDLSGMFLGLEEHNEVLNRLAKKSVVQSDIDLFLDKFYSFEDKKKKGKTIAKNNRETFLKIFESQTDSMVQEIANSRYGLLQAYTDFIDHESRKTEKTDEASIQWDSITGIRASKKEKVFQYLQTV